MKRIVGIGACVADTLLRVPHFPKEDTKIRATELRRAGGGPAATGLVAAAKAGVDTAWIGVLSDDAGGVFLKRDFEKYGVDTTLTDVLSGYDSFTSTVLLNGENASRTCVVFRGDLPPLTLSDKQKEAIAQADLLMVDGNELDAAVEAAKIARENGTTVLYDAGGLYEGVERLLALTDVLIPSEEFALASTGAQTACEAAEKLFHKFHPRFTVVTQGKDGGILFDGTARRYPCFAVRAVDTNGAGDVFHGAFAAALCRGYDAFACCHIASAVSALKCTGFGARESVPNWEQTIHFLKENGYEFETSLG